MTLEFVLILIDIAAGIVLLCRAFPALVAMSVFTCHRFRVIYIVLAVGAVGMVLSPWMDAEWRRYAHVAVIAALTLQALIDRRTQGRLTGAPS